MAIEGVNPSDSAKQQTEQGWFGGWLTTKDLLSWAKVTTIAYTLHKGIVQPIGVAARNGLEFFKTDAPEGKKQKEAYNVITDQIGVHFIALNIAEEQGLNRKNLIELSMTGKANLTTREIQVLADAHKKFEKVKSNLRSGL